MFTLGKHMRGSYEGRTVAGSILNYKIVLCGLHSKIWTWFLNILFLPSRNYSESFPIEIKTYAQKYLKMRTCIWPGCCLMVFLKRRTYFECVCRHSLKSNRICHAKICLWHKDYFRLIMSNKQKIQEKL